MTKIDIFSGFLGAGKTTLIKKLISEAYAGEKLVLIENELVLADLCKCYRFVRHIICCHKETSTHIPETERKPFPCLLYTSYRL